MSDALLDIKHISPGVKLAVVDMQKAMRQDYRLWDRTHKGTAIVEASGNGCTLFTVNFANGLLKVRECTSHKGEMRHIEATEDVRGCPYCPADAAVKVPDDNDLHWSAVSKKIDECLCSLNTARQVAGCRRTASTYNNLQRTVAQLRQAMAMFNEKPGEGSE